MYFLHDPEPADPAPRSKKAIQIPPVTFSGYAWGPQNSGFWNPPSSVRLTEGYVSAGSVGASNNLIQVIRIEPPLQETTLAIAVLPTLSTKVRFDFSLYSSTIDPPIINPFEPVVVRMWASSGHQNVVVQLIGEEP